MADDQHVVTLAGSLPVTVDQTLVLAGIRDGNRL
jgi:hypothetical protein